jgi:hypothetical protein
MVMLDLALVSMQVIYYSYQVSLGIEYVTIALTSTTTSESTQRLGNTKDDLLAHYYRLGKLSTYMYA